MGAPVIGGVLATTYDFGRAYLLAAYESTASLLDLHEPSTVGGFETATSCGLSKCLIAEVPGRERLGAS